MQVTPAYAERLFPIPPPPPPPALGDDPDHAAAVATMHAAITANIERRRLAAHDSWYPCRDCNGSTFYRWAGRPLDTDHNRHDCAECRLADEAHGKRGRREREPELLPKPTASADTGPGF